MSLVVHRGLRGVDPIDQNPTRSPTMGLMEGRGGGGGTLPFPHQYSDVSSILSCFAEGRDGHFSEIYFLRREDFSCVDSRSENAFIFSYFHCS